MGLQTATNPDTGETVVFDGKAWQKAEQTAANDKGEKAYLVGGKWLSNANIPNSAPEEPKRVAATMAGVNRGISGLVGLPVDTAENLVNLGIAGIGSTANAFGRPDLAPDLIHGTPGGSESVSGLLNKVGIGTTNPSPQDLASRLLYRGGVVAGGSMVPGARPLPTAASAVGGSLAGEVLGEPYTAVGAMAPAAAVQAGQAAKTAIANRVQPRVESFKDVGAQPSVGQATELNFIQGFENLLSKFPGGQGIFRQFAEKQQKQLGANTATGVSAEDAGRAVEKGVQGFIGRTKQTWKELDDQVAQKIPKASTFAPTNTVKALDDLTTPIPGAEKSTGTPLDARIAKIKADLTEDLQANNGVIPYEALRKIRSNVGLAQDDALVAGAKSGEMKKLYGALTQDLEAAANKAGAGKEFARQNDFYRARMQRIEGTLERVLGNTPEETFAKLMPKDANQATTLRATMRSLDPEQRKIVTQAAVDRLGRAAPSKQNEAGDVFSQETFLTNWNKLSDGAKAQLFSDPAMRKNLDSLAVVTDNLREGAKVFANPSGTAGASAPLGIGYLVGRGNIATAGTLVGGAYVGAKMLTSPTVVEWLAQYPKVAPEAASVHLARLGVIYNQSKDPELKQELATFINSVK